MKEHKETARPANGASPVGEDPWAELRRYTDARIALGRCGVSLPHAEWLAFRLDHAKARDAVLTPYEIKNLRDTLEAQGLPCLELQSAATNKEEFLARPDRGRKLSEASRTLLEQYMARLGQEKNHQDTPTDTNSCEETCTGTCTNGNMDKSTNNRADICLAISDGLSARAVHENAAPFAASFMAWAAEAGFSTTPVALIEYGRVAVADEIAHLLGARLVVILLGERPGLSSPNSLGVYLTYAPFPGCTDEARNCISNVRPAGLSIEDGVRKLSYLVRGAFARGLSGVNLKDDMPLDGGHKELV
ncbi:ethanolamine ammonia-lyase subunit EutC [Desulfovibrio intestinalis]|uniref:Ethanolamine ammonia-lyase small subunit n=1 Tax=Desulfovibrio intestinalis TaxID=58621 RepID=A0A7W8C2W9_9BACT|nr:ethanolamine ammonia-lyase subunit EutC [Desulfovibrio intestinalis]MBB5144346.1 ethanolamine ammonia-lyase small subunit [Desulfovibrio intestinalis]